MCQASLQSNRGPLFKFSQAKIKGMIETVIHNEKNKPGPCTYKSVDKAKDFTMDRTGSYRGICKSDVEQLLMVSNLKVLAEDKLKPGHYKPNYVSRIVKLFFIQSKLSIWSLF